MKTVFYEDSERLAQRRKGAKALDPKLAIPMERQAFHRNGEFECIQILRISVKSAEKLRRVAGLCAVFALSMLVGCGDFSNRTYRYGDAIPLNPFVMKAVQTQSSLTGKASVIISLLVTNQSTITNQISRSRFTLRVGPSREIHDIADMIKIGASPKSMDTSASAETIAFGPGESSLLKIYYVIAKEDLNERLALIVDHSITVNSKTKKRKETLSLIEIKDEAPPPATLADGSLRTFTFASWK